MSAIPVVKAYVTAMVTDSPLFAGVDITYGFPGRDIEVESFFVDVTDDDDTEWVVMSAKHSADETFSLRFVITANRQGQQQQEATERSFDLYEALRSLLDIDPYLGGNLTKLPCQIKRKSYTEHLVGDDGRGAQIIGLLRCSTRTIPSSL